MQKKLLLIVTTLSLLSFEQTMFSASLQVPDFVASSFCDTVEDDESKKQGADAGALLEKILHPILSNDIQDTATLLRFVTTQILLKSNHQDRDEQNSFFTIKQLIAVLINDNNFFKRLFSQIQTSINFKDFQKRVIEFLSALKENSPPDDFTETLGKLEFLDSPEQTAPATSRMLDLVYPATPLPNTLLNLLPEPSSSLSTQSKKRKLAVFQTTIQTTDINSSDTKRLKTHTGERPYQCTKCKKSFTQKLALERHIRTHIRILTECLRSHLKSNIR